MNGNVYGQYACRITGSILFHSVPYEKKDKSTLEWWEYDKLGTKASLGCVRLKVEDAKWIYNNCIPGTKVEFYLSSTPGPLGKPTAKKISGDEAVRNWDPTDPDPNNPWTQYLENKNQQTNTKPSTDNNINNEVQNNVNNINNVTSSNNIINNVLQENESSQNNIINSANTVSKNITENNVIY